jgi:hypothetical protein
MSSALSFTFRPSLIPAYAQAEFLTRFCQLVLDYETLTSPVPEAPSAEQIPAPSAFVPVDGDTPVSKKPRKNAWADLTEEQRTERVAKMRAGRAAAAAQRRVSEDSLAAPQPVRTPDEVGRIDGPAPEPAITDRYDAMNNQQLRDELADRDGIPPTPEGAKPSGRRRNTGNLHSGKLLREELRRRDALALAPAPAEDTASETSSAKKQRKNSWANLTEEQRQARLAKMRAAREAKIAARAAANAVTGSA